MSAQNSLEAVYLAAVEAHKTHPPRLRRDRDGMYRCAACDPAERWERVVDWLRFNRRGSAHRVCVHYWVWRARRQR